MLTLDEFRVEMETCRRLADEEGRSLKDSQLALERLYDLYLRFDSNERSMADQVLLEWALSENESVRFDALALIHRYKIVDAVPTLQTLAVRLASSSAPGAPYELRKVNRLLLSFGTVADRS
jgi:hypothetical protein